MSDVRAMSAQRAIAVELISRSIRRDGPTGDIWVQALQRSHPLQSISWHLLRLSRMPLFATWIALSVSTVYASPTENVFIIVA